MSSPESDDKNLESKEDFVFRPLHPEPEQPTPAAIEKPVPTIEPIAPSTEPATAIPPSKKPDWKAPLLKNKPLRFFLALAVIGGGIYGISRLRSDGEPKEEFTEVGAGDLAEIPVNAMEVKLGRFQDIISAVGTLKGEAEIELRFQVDGRIEELNLVEGAKVKKGQIIGRLNERDAMLKVQRAKNELEQTEKLFQLGGVSNTKLEEARLNLEVAQSELDKTRLIATRDGILGDKGADIGEFVTPQRKVATLVSIKNVVVKVGIIEKQVDKVFPKQKMLVTVDAYPGNVFEGQIESISPIITDQSKTFEITAKIPNHDSFLLPGMFARAKVVTYEVDDAMSIPNDALNKTQSGFQVFVITKDNIAEARDVQVVYTSSEFTQIESGINPGELVIVQKPPELKSGSKVKINEVQK